VSEQARVAHLQEQMNKVKRTMNQLPFLVYVTMLISGICLAAGSYFGQPWFWLFVVAGFCMAMGMLLTRIAKDQYNELVEQLKVVTFATITCSNCKKEIPLRINYTFESCPYCGNPLKK
jgi:hypothetical protein